VKFRSTDKGPRIAIGGYRLDEVSIRHAVQMNPPYVSSTIYPCSRHSARVDGDQIVISAQASTVAKLFADGRLPPIRKASVEIAIDGQSYGLHVLLAVEQGAWDAVDHPLVLKFEKIDDSQA
jgi:hypothetical protein